MLINEICQENYVWMAIFSRFPTFQKMYREFKSAKKYGMERFSNHRVLTEILATLAPKIEEDIDIFLNTDWLVPNDPDTVNFRKAAIDIKKNLEKDRREIEKYFEYYRNK